MRQNCRETTTENAEGHKSFSLMSTTGSLVSSAKPEFMKHVGIFILTLCATHCQTTLACKNLSFGWFGFFFFFLKLLLQVRQGRKKEAKKCDMFCIHVFLVGWLVVGSFFLYWLLQRCPFN